MNGFDNISAVILAGGNGSRLKTIVSDRQKVVAQINGRPFLSLLLAQIEKFGISKAVICTGYMSETVDSIVDEYDGPINISCSYEKVPLGTGGAVKNALPLIATDCFMLMNGDSFLDLDAKDFFQNFADTNNKAVMALAKVGDVSRYGAVVLNENKRISSFSEKSKNSRAGLINAGISLINKQLFKEYCPGNEKFSLEKDIFPFLAVDGKLSACLSDGKFIDIGTPDSYAVAQKLFKD